MQIKILLELCRGVTWPTIKIEDTVNTVVIDKTENLRNVIITCCPANNQVLLHRTNKQGPDTVISDGKIVRDQTVGLKKIWVDNILLDTHLVLDLAVYRNEFSQDYFDYCAQQHIDPEPVQTHWHTWYFNGTWQWQFEQPFWVWYCQQRQNKQKLGLTKEQVELYVGTGTDKHQQLMQQLRTLLQT
jgi:hypothetical protein